MRLHEELLLLVLSDEKGTAKGTYADLAVGAGVVGELITEGRLEVADDKHGTVTVVDASPTGDPALDLVLDKIASARRSRPLKAWIERAGNTRRMRDRVAESLVAQGVLRRQPKKVLGIFPTTRYPEADPEPQQELVERLRAAVVGDGPTTDVDERTCLVVAIAAAAEVLPRVLGRKEVAQRKERIAALASDERLGEATRKAVEQLQAAIVVVIAAGAASAGASGQ